MNVSSFSFESHRKQKTFFVRDYEEPTDNITKVYPHSIDMWTGEVSWRKVIANLSAQCKGSQEAADEIAFYLTLFKQIASRNSQDKIDVHVGKHVTRNTASTAEAADIMMQNWLEKQMYAELAKDSRFQVFLSKLGTVSEWIDPKNTTHQGEIFEEFIDRTVQAASDATGNITGSGQVGRVTARSQVSLGTIDITVPTGGSIFKKDKLGNITSTIKDDIIALAKSELNITHKMKRALSVQHIGTKGNTYTLEVVIGEDKQQKIDVDFGSLKIVQTDNGILNRFLSLVKGATFSAKNYNFGGGPEDTRGQSRRIHFGDTDYYRKYGSFWFVASQNPSKKNNGADIGTFAFATRKAIDKGQHSVDILTSYTQWVDFLYEVLGIGQKTTGRLVDYVVINNAGSPRDVIQVISMKEYLQHLTSENFKSPPDFLLDNNGMITLKRNIGGASFVFS